MKQPAVIATAALIAVASFSPPEAHAGDRGGAIAAGIIGGLAVGALAGSAIANSQRAPSYAYDEDIYVPVYRSRQRVDVYRYYGTPYYDSYGYYDGHGYSSGYRDGYDDASSGW
jgi:hypothetical protein